MYIQKHLDLENVLVASFCVCGTRARACGVNSLSLNLIYTTGGRARKFIKVKLLELKIPTMARTDFLLLFLV